VPLPFPNAFSLKWILLLLASLYVACYLQTNRELFMDIRLAKYSIIGMLAGLLIGLVFDKVGLFIAFGFASGVVIAVLASQKDGRP
jgi:hypothetical protein